MKRVVRRHPFAARAALVATVAAVVAGWPGVAHAAFTDTVFVSDTSWVVTDADPNVGPNLTLPAQAQTVCLTSTMIPCPAGSTIWGFGADAWNPELSNIPGAAWIWAPQVNGSTTPADNDAYVFTKTVTIPGTPHSGTLYAAADDGGTAYINGTELGAITGFGVLSAFDLGPHLVPGTNTIVIRAANASICGVSCPYSTNPAGLIAGGSITTEVDGPNGCGTPGKRATKGCRASAGGTAYRQVPGK